MAEMHGNIRDNEFVSILFSFKLCFSADFKWRELGKNLLGLVSIKSLQISCGRKLFPGSEFTVAQDMV